MRQVQQHQDVTMPLKGGFEHALRIGDVAAAQRRMEELATAGVSAFDPWMSAARLNLASAVAARQNTASSIAPPAASPSASALAPSSPAVRLFDASQLVASPIREPAASSSAIYRPTISSLGKSSSDRTASPPTKPATLSAAQLESVLLSPTSPLTARRKIVLLEATELEQRKGIARAQRVDLADIFTAAIADADESRRRRVRGRAAELEASESAARAMLADMEALDVCRIGASLRLEAGLAAQQEGVREDELRWRRFVGRDETHQRKALLVDFIRGAERVREDGHRMRTIAMEMAKIDALQQRLGGGPERAAPRADDCRVS